MLSNKKKLLSICALFFCNLFVNASTDLTTLNGFTSEFKKSIDTQKTFSLEAALSVLQNGYEICMAIENFGPNVSSKLGVQCGSCKNNILTCAGLAGHILASGALDEFKKLKRLLATADIKTINLFIVKSANEHQVKCVICEKFGPWVELDQVSSVK